VDSHREADLVKGEEGGASNLEDLSFVISK
jgi:hypothetical protein